MRTTNTPSSADRPSASDGVLHKAATGAHNAVDKVASAADDAARKAIPAIDQAADYVHQTVDSAVTGATPAAEWINDQAAAINATQQKLVSSTREYVVANPLKALGIALAAGFLVSKIIQK